jgi:hypothetical protein
MTSARGTGCSLAFIALLQVRQICLQLLQAEAPAKGSLVILNGGEAVVRDLTSIESIDAVDGIFEMRAACIIPNDCLAASHAS